MSWSVGDRVRHPSFPGWGLGEVVAVLGEGKIRVYFANEGETMLKDAPLTRAVGSEATQVLPRRRARPAGRTERDVTHQSIEAYKAAFLEQFPRGFPNPAYVHKERDYKVDAATLLKTSLSRPRLKSLVGEGSWAEITKRALAVISKTNLVFPNESMDLRDGLRSTAAKERFGRILFETLYGSADFPDRFERFCGFLIDIEAASWTVATYFPFLADYTTQMFLKPVPTKLIASACGVELNYDRTPNAKTYACLLRLSQHLKEVLRDLRPKDMIDVQSFIWIVAR